MGTGHDGASRELSVNIFQKLSPRWPCACQVSSHLSENGLAKMEVWCGPNRKCGLENVPNRKCGVENVTNGSVE